jgi:subfamily B ATP-binding cassette protein MsbA
MFSWFFIKILRLTKEDVASFGFYFKRFIKDFLKENLPLFLLGIFFMIIFSASTAGRLYMLKPIIDDIFVLKNLSSVYIISITVLSLAFCISFSQYAYTSLIATVSIKIINNARKNLYSKFLNQDLYFHQSNPPGQVMSVMVNDVQAINVLVGEVPINIGRDFFLFCALFINMLILEPIYSLILLIMIGFIIIPIKLVNKKISSFVSSNISNNGDFLSNLEQSLSGIKEIKSYNTEIQEQEKIVKILKNLRKIAFKMRSIQAILPSFIEISIGFLISGIIFYGGYNIAVNGKSPGNFVVFITSLIIAYQPLKRLADVHIKIKMGFLGLKRYYDFIDAEIKVKEVENAISPNITEYDIVFDKVNFAYNTKAILDNFNLKIENKKKIALVGKSGAGKTTIVSLINRFYDPQQGSILIGGYDIKQLSFKRLRPLISYVGQDVILFNDTIYNNIKYGSPNAAKEDVYKAAEDAYCLDFIEKSEKGFDTEIGPRGLKLSGGQKQRLSIARALLKNAPILLLDEATSALDTESEQYIQEAIKTLSENKTSVVIAHRLSTIINSDIIFVIDDGKILESGSHKDLINQNGVYKHLYNLQFKD